MFADPVKNLKSFDIREDMIVADLGAGSGFYSLSAAKLVPQGKVYAIEIDRDYVTLVKNKTRDEKITNLECLWGDIECIEGTHIKDHVIDRAIVSNVFSQLTDRVTFLKELQRILKPGGEVLFIDWSPGLSLTTEHRDISIPKNTVLDIWKHAGFEWVRDINAGSNHYGMILKNKN
ncbi:MAG: class I SAM-dependent methyltransferase [Candidatus Paceibacteria bacterium]